MTDSPSSWIACRSSPRTWPPDAGEQVGGLQSSWPKAVSHASDWSFCARIPDRHAHILSLLECSVRPISGTAG
jgi:hypothetical protein